MWPIGSYGSVYIMEGAGTQLGSYKQSGPREHIPASNLIYCHIEKAS